jgi:hypothetical protein
MHTRANAWLRTCALQGGLNCAAVAAVSGSRLTCKDSLLVGWGGGTDQDNLSCPVVYLWHEEPRLDLDRYQSMNAAAACPQQRLKSMLLTALVHMQVGMLNVC